MELIHGFKAGHLFYDDVNFPYGFSKSGFFSIPEAELLEVLGQRLMSLEHGHAQPENQVEENFVEFCNSENEPQTRVERLWAKYKKHAMRRSTVTLGSIISEISSSDSYDESSL